jgi:hypothetical protein
LSNGLKFNFFFSRLLNYWCELVLIAISFVRVTAFAQ